MGPHGIPMASIYAARRGPTRPTETMAPLHAPPRDPCPPGATEGCRDVHTQRRTHVRRDVHTQRRTHVRTQRRTHAAAYTRRDVHTCAETYARRDVHTRRTSDVRRQTYARVRACVCTVTGGALRKVCGCVCGVCVKVCRGAGAYTSAEGARLRLQRKMDWFLLKIPIPFPILESRENHPGMHPRG